jgi:hypothetical protein
VVGRWVDSGVAQGSRYHLVASNLRVSQPGPRAAGSLQPGPQVGAGPKALHLPALACRGRCGDRRPRVRGAAPGGVGVVRTGRGEAGRGGGGWAWVSGARGGQGLGRSALVWGDSLGDAGRVPSSSSCLSGPAFPSLRPPLRSGAAAVAAAAASSAVMSAPAGSPHPAASARIPPKLGGATASGAAAPAGPGPAPPQQNGEAGGRPGRGAGPSAAGRPARRGGSGRAEPGRRGRWARSCAGSAGRRPRPGRGGAVRGEGAPAWGGGGRAVYVMGPPAPTSLGGGWRRQWRSTCVVTLCCPAREGRVVPKRPLGRGRRVRGLGEQGAGWGVVPLVPQGNRLDFGGPASTLPAGNLSSDASL